MKLVTIVVVAVLLFSFSRREYVETGNPLSKPNQVDTLWISDSLLQIVHYGQRGIKSVRLINKSKVSNFESQSITFYENGLVESLQMALDSKLDSTDGYKVYIYDFNSAIFSKDGRLTKAIFMKDFTPFIRYPGDQPKQKRRKG